MISHSRGDGFSVISHFPSVENYFKNHAKVVLLDRGATSAIEQLRSKVFEITK